MFKSCNVRRFYTDYLIHINILIKTKQFCFQTDITFIFFIVFWEIQVWFPIKNKVLGWFQFEMSRAMPTQSLMSWGVRSSADIGLLCFLKNKVSASLYQEILVLSILPSFEVVFFFRDADLIFLGELGTCIHHCQKWQ